MTTSRQPLEFNERLAPYTYGMDATMLRRAYLAGPMRGKPMHNFPAFAQAALHLRLAGWEIENPAEHDLAAGVDPSADAEEWPVTVQDMLRTDFRIILERATAVIVLPGWQHSVGTKMEMAIAYHIGLPIFELRMSAAERTRPDCLRRLKFQGPPSVDFYLRGTPKPAIASRPHTPEPPPNISLGEN